MLKIFEAFSGVGAQHMALKNIGKKFEIVATSEIDKNSILAYFAVHYNKNYMLKKNDLINFNIINNITKNLGDITTLNTDKIPDHDIFTYSFPCQDISSLGTRKGLENGSGTRSSLLWECKKIIQRKKPKYLVMENVKNLISGKHKENFYKWLWFLESEGYENCWKIFDSQYYGIPQRRPRVIVVSKLGKSKINLIKDNNFKNKAINEIIDSSENNWNIFKPKAKIKGSIKEGEYLFLDDRDWKINGVMISNICSTQRAGRSGLKLIKKTNGVLFERRLNSLECSRLMGFKDEAYYSMKNIGLSNTAIMKICGNSIVVPVLENVFKNIYEEEELQ